MEVLDWVAGALGAVATLGHGAENRADLCTDVATLFPRAAPLFRRVAEFRAVALLSVDDDGLGFSAAGVAPAVDGELVEAEVAHMIRQGAFATALYDPRPVIVPSHRPGNWTVLHVLSTPTRVLGMFVGLLPDGVTFVPHVAQKVLSTLLAQCAAAVESGMLYAEMEAYSRNLEATVEKRTQALRASEAEARALARAKAEFLANMSHEIRTPINGVLGMTGLLLESELGPEQRDQAELVLRSADALLSIVNDVLDFSKLEAGKLELDIDDFDLRLALEDILDLLAPKVADKPVELVLRFDADVPRFVRGDSGRIRQVIMNLAANAVRFTDEGHVMVQVSRTSDGRLALSVEDTGVGIEPDRLEAMFEKFTQAADSDGRRAGGTGLGLSICRSLSRLMNGEVGAVSAPGEGSTFTLTIPLTEAEAAPEGPPALALPHADVALAVPDDRLRSVLAETVQRAGGRPVALEPAAVHGWIGSASPEATLVVDGRCGESVLRGAAAAARRRTGGRPRLVALLDTELRGRSAALLDAGYDGWAPKPVSLRRLRAALDRGTTASGEPRTGRADAPVSRRVLLAEDDAVNTMVATAMLEKLGCDVLAVPDGQEAVDAAARESFDLILLDGRMPNLDGYEAAKVLRARPEFDRIPIVALTADDRDSERERARALGMDDYLTKPITLPALREALDRWLVPGARQRAEARGVAESG